MTATQSTSRRSPSATPRRNTPVRLSQRGIGAVALAVAGLVVLAANGHAGVAVLGAYSLYLLVSGRAAAVARIVPSARQALRALAWTAAAVATATALQSQQGGATGPVLGLALAAALATVLRLTAGRRR